jgi:hypothetical protein
VAGYSSARLAFNEFTGGAWQLTQVTDGDFVLCHVFATNDIETPFVAIAGINQYANIPAARAGAESEISSLSGLPFAEFVAVGTVIYQTDSAYNNIPKARVRSAAAGETYVDFRGEQLYTPSGVATSHSLLSNLSSDDHLQYYNEARGDARYVLKTGDTMSGTLSVSVPAAGTSNLGWQGVTAQSADFTQGADYTLDTIFIYLNDPGISTKSTIVSPNNISLVFSDTGTGTTYNAEILDARITLSTSDGVTTYPTIPLLPEEVTTKEYVDKLAVLSVISPSINTTMTVNNKVALCSNTITITLPLASAVVTAIYIKNIDVGVITIDGNGSETIDGALTYALTNQWDSITLVSNGTGWFIL